MGKAMDKYSKVWHYFIRAKLMPTMNFSIVIKEKATLIYAIQSDKSIDVRLVIQNSILHGANHVTTRLYYPSLITNLCKVAGWYGLRGKRFYSLNTSLIIIWLRQLKIGKMTPLQLLDPTLQGQGKHKLGLELFWTSRTFGNSF